MIRADATGLKKSLCTGMGAQRPRGQYTANASEFSDEMEKKRLSL